MCYTHNRYGNGGKSMDGWLGELLSRLLKWENISFPAGIFGGWIIFEITERRRTHFAQKQLRRAVVAELEHAEVLASVIVAKYARIQFFPFVKTIREH